MPLHLLGKKSWNVYNTANIEKVRKDEKDAAAREEAEEQRMQEVDAERRIRQLRGLQTNELSDAEAPKPVVEAKPHRNELPRPPKRKRLLGEDDTDRDLRLAQHTMSLAPKALGPTERQPVTSNAPLVDASGHTNLFPMESSKHRGPKNTEAEAEKAKKAKELEDQYTMRFSNAAGFKNDIGQAPWYQTAQALENDKEEALSKDVWGRSDPRRKGREQMRLEASDPLLMIKRGVKELRKVEQERKQWNTERMKELGEPRSSEKKRRRRRHHDDSELDDFRLDDPSETRRRSSSHQKERHRSHRHHSRSEPLGKGHRRRPTEIDAAG